MTHIPGGHPSQDRSSTGLDPALAGLLCYLLLWVSGLIFLLLEKESRFVRFHALQSLFAFGGISALYMALTFLSFFLGWLAIFPLLIGVLLLPLLGILMFVLWIVLMVKAYQGEMWEMPIVGELAARYA